MPLNVWFLLNLNEVLSENFIFIGERRFDDGFFGDDSTVVDPCEIAWGFDSLLFEVHE